MTQTATSPQRKPLLDEASFQQLLSAAHVLQEHNDRLRGKEVHADFAKNLSAIVETQKLIQTLQLDLEAAAKLVAERVQRITHASGAAIGIVEKGELVYRAGTGTAAVDAGTRMAPASSLSADCLSQGNALHYIDASANSQPRAKLFRDREVKSFVAVPVYHAGRVAGVLELRFAQANSFREADLRTAELMAGLLSEAMATAARMKWKDALVSERQSMLEALERIKPQLERLGTESLTDGVVGPPLAHEREMVVTRGSRDACTVCGSDFIDKGESFCGICGTARPAAPPEVQKAPPRFEAANLQTKTSSPTITPYGAEDPPNGNSSPGTKSTAFPASLQELIELSAIQQDPAAHFDKHFEKREAPQPVPLVPAPAESSPAPRVDPDFFARPSNTGAATANQANQTAAQFSPPDHFAPAITNGAAATRTAATRAGDPLRIVPVDLAPANLAAVNLAPVNAGAPSEKLQPYPWGSAKKAQQWLETVKSHQGPTAKWMAHLWQTRRANIYIGIAGLILVAVISGWGIRPTSTAIAGNTSSAVAGRRQTPPAPKLTAFENLLVGLGLAEAPPAPSYMGNPDTQVWVDVHTALYHCPGSDLFGKTPDGRLTTQRDAQQDQFEPANRKACP